MVYTQVELLNLKGCVLCNNDRNCLVHPIGIWTEICFEKYVLGLKNYT